jgi:hypothetical protein
LQFEGGYRYPSTAIFRVLTLIAVLCALIVGIAKGLTILEGVAVLLSLEGTVLVASAFTPVGLTPPQGSLTDRFGWFLRLQGGTQVKLSQPMLYGGLLSLFIGMLLQTVVR